MELLDSVVDDPVDKTVFGSLSSGHEVVAFRILADRLVRLAGVRRENSVERFLRAEDVIGVNFDIGRLTLHSAERLMYHDLGVGERKTFALCTGRKQKRAH